MGKSNQGGNSGSLGSVFAAKLMRAIRNDIKKKMEDKNNNDDDDDEEDEEDDEDGSSNNSIKSKSNTKQVTRGNKSSNQKYLMEDNDSYDDDDDDNDNGMYQLFLEIFALYNLYMKCIANAIIKLSITITPIINKFIL